MKVSVVTYSVTRRAGGVFDAVRDLFTNKNFKECALQLFSFEDKDNADDIASWKGIKLRLYKSGLFLSSRQMRQALLSVDADILHMEALWRCPHRWMADWVKRRKEPIVCSPHGMLDPYIIKSQGKLKRLISRLFFQKALEAVTCFHALCFKELEDIRTYGLKQPVAIIPNGINLHDFKDYKRLDDKRHLLYLGRLHKKKGVDIMLKAIAGIKRTSPGLLSAWHIDLVGWDHENCKAELENIVRNEGLESLVTFHGGLFGDEKTRMYATADAYILPSHGEGLPMTVLEAWSWKLPVVMTSQCNIPEGFEAGAAIKIEDNVDSVKEGLTQMFLMSDKDLKEIGENGYNLVSEKFTWDASAKKMLQLYEWLIGKGKRPEFVYE